VRTRSRPRLGRDVEVFLACTKIRIPSEVRRVARTATGNDARDTVRRRNDRRPTSLVHRFSRLIEYLPVARRIGGRHGELRSGGSGEIVRYLTRQKSRACSMFAKWPGNDGPYLSVLKCDSICGLSFKHAVASGCALNPARNLPAGRRKGRPNLFLAMSTSISAAPTTPSSSTPRGAWASSASSPQAPIQSLFLTAAVFRSVLLGGFVQVMFGV